MCLMHMFVLESVKHLVLDVLVLLPPYAIQGVDLGENLFLHAVLVLGHLVQI